MKVRRETAQTPAKCAGAAGAVDGLLEHLTHREATGAWSREGGRRTLCGTLTA
jgi:hypothetical protein